MNTHKPWIFIFDIDGTLAAHTSRGPFEEHKVHTDTPILPVLTVLRALFRDGQNIVFVSGRTKGCEQATRKWLSSVLSLGPETYNAEDFELYMRNVGDNRPDRVVKKEIYDEFITPYYNVIGVFDDRLQVLEMLWENKFFTFSVNQGNKRF